jgi:hypothetical protein
VHQVVEHDLCTHPLNGADEDIVGCGKINHLLESYRICAAQPESPHCAGQDTVFMFKSIQKIHGLLHCRSGTSSRLPLQMQSNINLKRNLMTLDLDTIILQECIIGLHCASKIESLRQTPMQASVKDGTTQKGNHVFQNIDYRCDLTLLYVAVSS